SGILLVVSGGMLLFRRDEGIYVYSTALAATLIWSIAEAGLDWWRLVPRLDVWVVLALALLLPQVRRGLSSPSRGPRRALIAVTGLTAAALVASLANGRENLQGQIPNRTGLATADVAGPSISPNDWVAYGRSNLGDRFAPARQITPD